MEFAFFSWIDAHIKRVNRSVSKIGRIAIRNVHRLHLRKAQPFTPTRAKGIIIINK